MAESTPGLWDGQKDCVNEKFQLHHRESNPRPYNAVTLTTAPPRAPNVLRTFSIFRLFSYSPVPRSRTMTDNRCFTVLGNVVVWSNRLVIVRHVRSDAVVPHKVPMVYHTFLRAMTSRIHCRHDIAAYCAVYSCFENRVACQLLVPHSGWRVAEFTCQAQDVFGSHQLGLLEGTNRPAKNTNCCADKLHFHTWQSILRVESEVNFVL